MGRFPPVPMTVFKSVQVGSAKLFLYCTVYDIPFSVSKDRLKIPLTRVGAPMTGTSGARANAPRQPQLAAAATVRARQMSMPVAVTVLVAVKLTTKFVVKPATMLVVKPATMLV